MDGEADVPRHPGRSRYPARERERNTALISDTLTAASESAFGEALRALRADFHPAVISEIDWAERAAPDEERDAFAHHADGIFAITLDCNLALRRADFELGSDELHALVAEHRGFFDRHWAAEPHVREAVGEQTARRIDAALAAGDAPAQRPEGGGAAIVGAVGDPARLSGVIDVALSNLLSRELDRPLTHEPAKAFTRGWHGRTGEEWPTTPSVALGSPTELESLTGWLEAAASVARYADLGRWADEADGVRAALVARYPTLNRACYEGEQITGSGNCSRCSMHFASTSLLAFGTACSSVRRDGGAIVIASGTSTAACPFCGYTERINAPSLFHDADRRAVVYCVPRTPGEAEETAIERWAPMLQDGRERYRQHLPAGEVAAFDACTEIVTSSAAEFFDAIRRSQSRGA